MQSILYLFKLRTSSMWNHLDKNHIFLWPNMIFTQSSRSFIRWKKADMYDSRGEFFVELNCVTKNHIDLIVNSCLWMDDIFKCSESTVVNLIFKSNPFNVIPCCFFRLSYQIQTSQIKTSPYWVLIKIHTSSILRYFWSCYMYVTQLKTH